MKIAIDARQYGSRGTGIGKYTEKLIENLQKIDKENTYFVILRKENWHFFNPPASNFEKVMVDAPFYSLKEQALLPAALMKLKPDFVHFTHFNVPLLFSGKYIVTIHDLITKEFSGSGTTSRSFPVYLLKRSGYEITIRQAVTRAKKIIVPSKFVKDKLHIQFPADQNKTEVIYEGVEKTKNLEKFQANKILPKYGIKKPYLLYVGSYYPHKNVNALVQSLTLLDNKYQLVLVGERNIFLERILKIAESFQVKNQIITPGFVSNEDLRILYKEATCFVFPSFSEGFGLPGLEAMASGCPVVCSNISVFKEIYGEAALYFNPKNPEDIAVKIRQTSTSKQKKLLVDEGFEQVKKYSWQKMAEETLAIYQKLA